MMALGKEIELVDCTVSSICQKKLYAHQPSCTYYEIQFRCSINHCMNYTGVGESLLYFPVADFSLKLM